MDNIILCDLESVTQINRKLLKGKNYYYFYIFRWFLEV